MMSQHTSETATIRAFIGRDRRDRWLAMLANLEKRRQFLDRLNHHDDWDSRYAIAIDTDQCITALLRARGAPAACYVNSDNPDLDARAMPLDEAVDTMEQLGFGTIICCVAGALAFHYGEHGEFRLLLHRPPVERSPSGS